jgi:transcriptional regulator with XRE-family HTH domain
MSRKQTFSLEEVSELLAIKGWSRAKLAEELGVSVNWIDRWFMRDRNREPSGPACLLMRQWLADARGHAQTQKVG